MKNYYPFPLWSFIGILVIAAFYVGLIASVKYSEEIEGFFNWLLWSKFSRVVGISIILGSLYFIVQRAKYKGR